MTKAVDLEIERMKNKDVDKMIEILGQNKDRFQTKMLMHQLIKMTLAETEPSIEDALEKFAGAIGLVESGYIEQPVIPRVDLVKAESEDFLKTPTTFSSSVVTPRNSSRKSIIKPKQKNNINFRLQ